MKFPAFVFSMLLCILSSCSGHEKHKVSANEPIEESLPAPFDSLCIPEQSLKDLLPSQQYILVEGAVDSWFFFHLHDYRSYEAIIRTTDFIEDKGYFIHKVRYRASTLEGGYETDEKIFRVTINISNKGIPNFDVEDITGRKSLTEKENL